MTDIAQLSMFRQKDIEKLFAGCVFISPIEAVQQCGWLKPELIINTEIRHFWERVVERVKPEQAGTDQTAEILLQISMEIGIMAELTSWMQDVTFSHLPLPYANEIARRAYMTHISVKLGDLVRAINTGDDGEARRIIKAMGELDITSKIKLPDAFDIADEFVRIIQGEQRSVNTFIPPLDAATGGLERQTLSVLAGLPSTGKSALAWQIGRTLAYNGQKALFFSLEMSKANIFARAACPGVGVNWKDARANRLSPEQRERLIDEAYKIAANLEDRLAVVGGPQDTETIWQTVAQMRPDLVIIDHLRLVKDKNPNEIKRQGQIAERVKEIAINFDCAALLLAQLHRIPTERRPELNDLRDSGEIEETGDMVMMLYSEEVKTQPKPDKRLTECWVRKNRDGVRDILVKLAFDTRMQWFEEMQK